MTGQRQLKAPHRTPGQLRPQILGGPTDGDTIVLAPELPSDLLQRDRRYALPGGHSFSSNHHLLIDVGAVRKLVSALDLASATGKSALPDDVEIEIEAVCNRKTRGREVGRPN